MIRSMTGFGRAQRHEKGLKTVFEIKSVNHRFFEYSSRLPRGYMFLDERLRRLIGQVVSRGKVDVFLSVETESDSDCSVTVNHSLAKAYLRAFEELQDTYHLTDDVSVTMMARIPDILTVCRPEQDEESLYRAIEPVVLEALDRFAEMREAEGARLAEDILSRCDAITEAVAYIEERSPASVQEHMNKVKARMQEILKDIPVDERLMLNEAAVYADKIAVAEETVRMRSHLDQLRHMLESPQREAVGRKLDFLVQEMNREANTIGSKASDIHIVRKVVDVRAEIEKIREQVQNIE